MSKKVQLGLVAVLAVAACAGAPAMAQATPQFKVNGNLLGTPKKGVIVFGNLSLKNKMFGEWKCKIVADMLVNNENGAGLGNWEGWEPFLCQTTACQGQSYVTAEENVKLEEKVNAKGETEYSAIRGAKTTHWPVELKKQETTEKKVSLITHKMHLIINCPKESFEPNFTGFIEPHWVNGIGNGLTPSHVVFEGEGGTTSWLNGTWLGGKETPETILYVQGELTVIGNTQELVTSFGE
jgi:hypothetical protein